MLASGKRSTYYIDARPTTMSGEGLTVIGALGLARLQARGWAPRAVGGLTLGADPVAYAIATAARAYGVALDAFTVRRQAKTHGTGRRIEGCFGGTPACNRSAVMLGLPGVVQAQPVHPFIASSPRGSSRQPQISGGRRQLHPFNRSLQR